MGRDLINSSRPRSESVGLLLRPSCAFRCISFFRCKVVRIWEVVFGSRPENLAISICRMGPSFSLVSQPIAASRTNWGWVSPRGFRADSIRRRQRLLAFQRRYPGLSSGPECLLISEKFISAAIVNHSHLNGKPHFIYHAVCGGLERYKKMRRLKSYKTARELW